MCKNFIITKIEKAVILSCQRIVNVPVKLSTVLHSCQTGTRNHPLGGVLKNELLYWSFSIITTTIQADNSKEEL